MTSSVTISTIGRAEAIKCYTLRLLPCEYPSRKIGMKVPSKNVQTATMENGLYNKLTSFGGQVLCQIR